MAIMVCQRETEKISHQDGEKILVQLESQLAYALNQGCGMSLDRIAATNLNQAKRLLKPHGYSSEDVSRMNQVNDEIKPAYSISE